MLEDASIDKVGHDLKFDAIVLARHGVTLRGLDLDTMLASYLLDATRSEHPLEDLALEHTSYKALTEEDVCGRGAKAMSLADLPAEAALDYAGERADLAGQLAPLFRELLADRAADRGLRDARAAADPGAGRRRARRRAHRRRRRWPRSRSTSSSELAQRSAQIFELAGERFNINSPQAAVARSCSTSCSCRC